MYRGYNSVGRVLLLQGKSQRFESAYLHRYMPSAEIRTWSPGRLIELGRVYNSKRRQRRRRFELAALQFTLAYTDMLSLLSLAPALTTYKDVPTLAYASWGRAASGNPCQRDHVRRFCQRDQNRFCQRGHLCHFCLCGQDHFCLCGQLCHDGKQL